MKSLTDKKLHTGSTAWGADHTSLRQYFEVEPSDVGRTKQNYLGFGRGGYMFKPSDVGKTLEEITEPNSSYNCFSFCRV